MSIHVIAPHLSQRGYSQPWVQAIRSPIPGWQIPARVSFSDRFNVHSEAIEAYGAFDISVVSDLRVSRCEMTGVGRLRRGSRAKTATYA